MSDDDPADRVLDSVAAYSNDPEGYRQRYAEHLLDRPRRFAALLAPPADILDAGCGPGRDLALFVDAGHRPVGVDLNPDFAAMASAHAPTLRADLRGIDQLFAPATFDGVWAQSSLVHLGETDVGSVLAGFATLARPGGLLFTCVAASGPAGWRDEPDGRRWYHVWDPASFADAVEVAGFEVLERLDGPYVEVWARRR